MEICGQHGDLCNVYCDSFVHFKESYTNKNFIRKEKVMQGIGEIIENYSGMIWMGFYLAKSTGIFE